MSDDRLGVSGRIARSFQSASLTPLIALVLLLGELFAIGVTPREEEPQIDVTMANVIVAFPGASAPRWRRGRAARRAGVLADRRRRAHLLGRPRGPGDPHRAVRRRRAAQRGDGEAVRHGAVQPGLAAPGSRRAAAGGQAQGHRRRADRWRSRCMPAIRPSASDLERVGHAIEADLKRVAGVRAVATVGGPGRACASNPTSSGAAFRADAGRPARALGGRQRRRTPAGRPRSRQRRARSAFETGDFVLSRATELADVVVAVRAGKPVSLATWPG